MTSYAKEKYHKPKFLWKKIREIRDFKQSLGEIENVLLNEIHRLDALAKEKPQEKRGKSGRGEGKQKYFKRRQKEK